MISLLTLCRAMDWSGFATGSFLLVIDRIMENVLCFCLILSFTQMIRVSSCLYVYGNRFCFRIE